MNDQQAQDFISAFPGGQYGLVGALWGFYLFQNLNPSNWNSTQDVVIGLVEYAVILWLVTRLL